MAWFYRLLVLELFVVTFSCQHRMTQISPISEDRVILKEGVEALLHEGDYAELAFVKSTFIQVEKVTTDLLVIRVLGPEGRLIRIPEQGYAPTLALKVIRLRDKEAVLKMKHDFLF